MKMNDTVCLIGAGINKSVNDSDGISPPLTNDFFKTALQMRKFSQGHYVVQIRAVYDYIEKYWKKDIENLRTEPFDLEECLTLVTMQYGDAVKNNNFEEMQILSKVYSQLTRFMAELLTEFEYSYATSDAIRNFGDYLFKEKPMIITFNYDFLIESAIAMGSRVNAGSPPRSRFGEEVSNEELAYSHFNWNRPLGYAIKFDEVQLYRAGVQTFVNGQRFYSHPQNNQYNWNVLKLHGSLNWFSYSSIPSTTMLQQTSNEGLPADMKDHVIITQGNWWFTTPPSLNGWYLEPLIIPPTILKDQFLNEPLYKKVLSPQWNIAKKELSNCKKLIVIGYSFPQTDFLSKKLFLEAFAENNLEKLIVVNPDEKTIDKTKILCHYDNPETFVSLADFMSN